MQFRETSKESFMKRLAGKVAVVTGGNSGIGLATAKLFRTEGAKVVISGRNQKALDEAVNAIGGDVLGVRADVSKPDDIQRLFTTVAEKWGKIDVLFANAGVGKFLPVADATESHFDEIFDVNVRGLFFTVQKALPHLMTDPQSSSTPPWWTSSVCPEPASILQAKL